MNNFNLFTCTFYTAEKYASLYVTYAAAVFRSVTTIHQPGQSGQGGIIWAAHR